MPKNETMKTEKAEEIVSAALLKNSFIILFLASSNTHSVVPQNIVNCCSDFLYFSLHFLYLFFLNLFQRLLIQLAL